MGICEVWSIGWKVSGRLHIHYTSAEHMHYTSAEHMHYASAEQHREECWVKIKGTSHKDPGM